MNAVVFVVALLMLFVAHVKLGFVHFTPIFVFNATSVYVGHALEETFVVLLDLMEIQTSTCSRSMRGK